MMAEGIGVGGVLREEVEALRPEVGEIHQGLADLRRLGQLPFQDLPYHDDFAARVLEKGREIRDTYQTILLLGIGGSALGATFLSRVLGRTDGPELIVCDDLDPREWNRIAERIDFKKTLLLVISKSGKTLETWAAFLFFYERLKGAVGSRALRRLLVITDPQKGPLRHLASRQEVSSLEIPPGVGGRYSVLTAVGLLPAVCIGIDIMELLAGARRMDERCKGAEPWFNPALMSAALHYLHASRRGRPIRVTMPYGQSLDGFAPWFAQLWAESLGKCHVVQGVAVHVGSTPVSALGPRDQHSQLQLYLEGPDDKAVTFVGTEQGDKAQIPGCGDPLWKDLVPAGGEDLEEIALLGGRPVQDLLTFERRATEEALKQAGRPNQTILLRQADAYEIGQLIYMAELETVYSGEIYDINPFDQPAVEMIKRNIRGYLTGKITHQKGRTYTI